MKNDGEAASTRTGHQQRSDLILPIYYIDALVPNHPAERSGDSLAEVIHSGQYSDWRTLRFKLPKEISTRVRPVQIMRKDLRRTT